MPFWQKRDQRLKGKAKRNRKSAARKEQRAAKAAGKGNADKAERLNAKAAEKREKAERNLFWDHAVVEMRSYRPAPTELAELQEALERARERALRVEAHLENVEGMPKDDAAALWDSGPEGRIFGNDPDPAHRRKLIRRARKIANALLRENLFIKLIDKGRRFGSAVPSELNRPFSRNVRIRIDLPFHMASDPVAADRIEELSDTIVHEIAHTLNVVTNEPGDATKRKALRNPASFGEYWEQF